MVSINKETAASVSARLLQNRVNGCVGYLQQYTHDLNPIRWLLDDAQPLRCRSADFEEHGVSGVAALEASSVRVSLESGWINDPGRDEHTRVYFEHGWVKTQPRRCFCATSRRPGELFRADSSHPERMWIDPSRFLGEFQDRVFHVHGKEMEIDLQAGYELGVEPRAPPRRSRRSGEPSGAIPFLARVKLRMDKSLPSSLRRTMQAAFSSNRRTRRSTTRRGVGSVVCRRRRASWKT